MKLSEQHEWIRDHQIGTRLVASSNADIDLLHMQGCMSDEVFLMRGISYPRKWSRFVDNQTRSPNAI